MLQFFSKAFARVARPANPVNFLNASNQALKPQLLYTDLARHFSNAKQKVIVRYNDELKPFTINNLWDNDGEYFQKNRFSTFIRRQKKGQEIG